MSGTAAAFGFSVVVRTTTPNLTAPGASLFGVGAGGHYLIETDPRFANYRNWLGSDYLLARLGLDPNMVVKSKHTTCN